ELGGDRELIGRVVERVKERELAGYTYEAADASFELLLRAETEGHPRRYFRTESWRAIVEDRPDGTHANETTVKLWAKGERIVATAEGNGPVNALDRALRRALEAPYPELAKMELVDYTVRILAGEHTTRSRTRVLISTADRTGTWTTVGVADNIITASLQALQDAYTYGLVRRGIEPEPTH
ncbi:alpha-isopropylmalate synthase regulatory domain-containing protein, partial [Streptomyces sp. NPDC058685]|uniref:alpha-isopropylmalate synthase regulatory domain-containing protein n=1 Tax=Streptomyces sp. NPDC058685 TaxID=3346598 RepID=UPI00364A4152